VDESGRIRRVEERRTEERSSLPVAAPDDDDEDDGTEGTEGDDQGEDEDGEE
jgi:hypothetical protein